MVNISISVCFFISLWNFVIEVARFLSRYIAKQHNKLNNLSCDVLSTYRVVDHL